MLVFLKPDNKQHNPLAISDLRPCLVYYKLVYYYSVFKYNINTMTNNCISLITGSVVAFLGTPLLPFSPKGTTLEPAVTSVFQQVQAQNAPSAEEPSETARKVASMLCNIFFDMETPETLLMRLTSSPHAKELWEKVQETRRKEGSPEATIRFATPEEVAEYPVVFQGGAYVSPSSGVINISPHLPRNERLACLLFELANLSNTERFAAIRKDVCEKRISCNAYALRTERIEFDSNALANKITHLAVEHAHWGVDMLSTLRVFATVEEYLAHVLKSGHFQNYVHQGKRFQEG